jgi:putative transposase
MGKKINGRKKHIMVDTLGLLLGCHVTTANISDNQGSQEFVKRFYLPCIQKVWADQAYAGVPLKLAYADQGIDLEIIKRSDTKFKILPKRWIVERTFSWMNRYRRLSKDYESLLQTTESWCYISMMRLMIKRISPTNFRF